MADDSITTEDSAHNHGHIEQVDLQGEMQRSYLDYAMASSSAARCPTCATASSPCTAA